MKVDGHRTIDRRSAVALHVQCRDLLLARIKGGEVRPGEAIPPERALCESFGLSRITVRAAIDDLVRHGILRRVQGKGTFVSHHALPLDLHTLTSFSEDMRARGKRPSARLLRLERVEPDAVVASALGATTPVWSVSRLRFADDDVMGLQHVYLPERFELEPSDVDGAGSLHRVLNERYHVTLETAEETLRAVALEEADAALLHTEPGAPALRIERTSFDAVGFPVEFCTMLYRADRYVYAARLVRHD